jgi:hypothetical protein
MKAYKTTINNEFMLKIAIALTTWAAIVVAILAE